MRVLGGSVRELPGGRWQADRSAPTGRRERSNHATLALARDWLLQQHVAQDSMGRQLTAGETVAYREAVAVLPVGVSLVDAARYYAARHAPGPGAGMTVRAVYDLHLQDRTRANLRPRSLSGIVSMLRPLLAIYGDVVMADVSGGQLAAWLDGLPVGPTSRAAYRRYVHSLWAFGARLGACELASVLSLPRVRLDESAPEILSPAAADSLCSEAFRRGHGPAVAIALYAGLRTSEVLALTWADVDLAGGTIRVLPEVAKKRRQRLVEIGVHLAVLLAGFGRRRGVVERLGAMSWHNERPRIAKAAGVAWPHNAARHSYCSYALALWQDAAKVAMMAGSSVDVVFRNYRALCRPETARAYFHEAGVTR